MKKTYSRKARLDEFQHDGAHIPAHPTRMNQTDKPTVYYVAVDYVFNLSPNGGYLMKNGNITDSASNADFKYAAVTTVPSSLKAMVDRAVQRYGKDRYVLVYKEDYSYGVQTHKRHARSGKLVDAWIPPKDGYGGYWQYGYAPINALQESGTVVNESDKLFALKFSCNSNRDYDATFTREDVEDEMKELGLKDLKWEEYVLDHMFSDSKDWNEKLEDAILLPNVKSAVVELDGDVVKIQKIRD